MLLGIKVGSLNEVCVLVLRADECVRLVRVEPDFLVYFNFDSSFPVGSCLHPEMDLLPL